MAEVVEDVHSTRGGSYMVLLVENIRLRWMGPYVPELNGLLNDRAVLKFGYATDYLHFVNKKTLFVKFMLKIESC